MLFREGGVRVIGIITSPSLPISRRNSTWAGMVHATDWMPSYYSWAAASAKVTWPPEPIAGHPREPWGFDGHDMIPALWAGGESPRTEVVHAVVNQHNPPGFPSGQMAAQGYPYSCAASSFCGGALRVGDYKLLVGYPGWDEHYTYPNNHRVSPNTQLHWDVCKSHCLFDVATDVAEMHDLSADPGPPLSVSLSLSLFLSRSRSRSRSLALSHCVCISLSLSTCSDTIAHAGQILDAVKRQWGDFGRLNVRQQTVRSSEDGGLLAPCRLLWPSTTATARWQPHWQVASQDRTQWLPRKREQSGRCAFEQRNGC